MRFLKKNLQCLDTISQDGKDIFQRAQARVKEILENHRPVKLDAAREQELDAATSRIMDELRITELPFGPK